MNVLAFPRTPANNSYGPQFVPPAPMIVDAPEDAYASFRDIEPDYISGGLFTLLCVCMALSVVAFVVGFALLVAG